MNVIDWNHAKVLSARYASITIGSYRSLFLLLMQAPIIGFFLTIVWKNEVLTLYFIMIVSCFWFGCINACKEIVKERDIFLRERMFGLNIPAYVLSKIYILSFLCAAQCFIILFIVHIRIDLSIQFGLVYVILLLCSTGGLTMGLIISSFVDSTDKAIALAPVVTIPQIMFSNLLNPRMPDFASFIEKLMVVKWGVMAVEEMMKKYNTDWMEVVLYICVLLAFSILYSITTVVILKRKEK